MTLNDGFNRTVSEWLNQEAGRGAPGYLDEVLARTTRTRQRPAWSSLERWLPMQLTLTGRFAPIPRRAWAVALVALLVLAAAALLIAGVGRQPRLPHFGSAANGAIEFVDGKNLMRAAADGTDVRVASTLPSGIESLTFSPDGTHLAYRTTGTQGSIVVADPDGSHPVNVTSGTTVSEAAQIATGGPFAWSPDGHRLAFARVITGDLRTINVVDADGSHMTQLIPDPAATALDRFDPAWTPDGQWISFFSTEASGAVSINLIHPDGTAARRLPTSPVNAGYAEMSWAPDPDQSLLEFVSGDYVKVFDLGTNKETDVGAGFWASWSPDAKRIAWWDAVVGLPGSSSAGGIQIGIVDEILAGSPKQEALFPDVDNSSCYAGVEGVGICSPAEWSPDSRWIFGPDPTGRSIVFATVDVPRTVRTIALDNPVDLSNGPLGYMAWQPIAP